MLQVSFCFEQPLVLGFKHFSKPEIVSEVQGYGSISRESSVVQEACAVRDQSEKSVLENPAQGPLDWSLNFSQG
jgi:hypothetical protein